LNAVDHRQKISKKREATESVWANNFWKKSTSMSKIEPRRLLFPTKILDIYTKWFFSYKFIWGGHCHYFSFQHTNNAYYISQWSTTEFLWFP
jgi:hypothetical protein